MSALSGAWHEGPDTDVVAVHAVLLKTNKIIIWSYWDTGIHSDSPMQFGEWAVLDLATGTTRSSKGAPNRNLFCCGQALQSDGRVLAVGGERGSPVNNRAVSLFDPDTEQWVTAPDLAVGRWYPTVATLPDGRGIAFAGTDWVLNSVPNETFQTFASDGGASQTVPFDSDFTTIDDATYPFIFVLPRRRLFAHVGTRTRVLPLTDPLDFGAAERLLTVRRISRTYPLQGSCVLLPLRPPNYEASVLLIGGGSPGDSTTPATASCERLDVDSPPLAWRNVAAMGQARVMPDAVLLPTGDVLVVNGSTAGHADAAVNPVFEAELYDPENDDWSVMARMSVPRLYHSTALLLPDGRVWVAGSDREWNLPPFDVAHTESEIFSPPYLFMGPRPSLASVPASLVYGQAAPVSVTSRAGVSRRASLMRCGSATHSFNSDQRMVEVELREPPEDPNASRCVRFIRRVIRALARRLLGRYDLELIAPPSPDVAPPGYYMLFVFSDANVPSVAKMVRLDSRGTK